MICVISVPEEALFQSTVHKQVERKVELIEKEANERGECVFAVTSYPSGPICSLKLCDKDQLSECCPSCDSYKGLSRGVGDVVKNVTNAMGMKTCGKCQKRREALNNLIPFSRSS